MILKVDLSKAFDRTNWLYLRLLLTHLGFPYNYIKWTMSCITDVSYSVLLNGEATTFFTAERGLRQGCPLSPLLFLLIMEGLSRVLSSARDRHLLTGIKIADDFYLTHLFFVDDILIFLNGSIGDTTTLQNAMLLFQQATGMKINEQKSSITSVGCSVHESVFATQRFPFNSLSLADGIKYLGFRLKPNGYRIADWLWLIAKVEKRLQVWYHRYLSRAGKLILIKAVIEATPLLTSESLWTRVAYAKYINPLNVLDWFCSQQNSHNVSIIWKAVINTIPLLRDGLTWRIKDGNSVRIRLDPWVGCGNAHRLPIYLIRHLNDRGITHIIHAGDPANSTFLQQAWLNAHNLEIPAQWHAVWMEYTDALTQAHIRLTEGPDEIIWAFAKHGAYAPKLGYMKLIEPIRPPNIHPTWRALWKLKSAPRTRLLMWNILFDKIPMSTNLMK
eukprot:PITA_25399